MNEMQYDTLFCDKYFKRGRKMHLNEMARYEKCINFLRKASDSIYPDKN